MDRRGFLITSCAAVALPAYAKSVVLPEMNQAIKDAVGDIYEGRRGGGYNLSYAYTADLDYLGDKVAQFPPEKDRADGYKKATMCVAAAAEIIIYALNKMAGRYGDAIGALPASSWQRGNLVSLKPYLFMQEDVHDVFGYKPGDTPSSMKNGKRVFALSRGAAHSFSIFRMGQELPFARLLPGDFINLNRANGTGHCVVFLGYIDAQNNFSEAWSPKPLGFRYFSAQGPHEKGGFDYRDAYFNSSKPHPKPNSSYKGDGTILPQMSQVYLNSGRLFSPDKWDIAGALAAIKAKAEGKFTQRPVRGATPDYYELQEQGPSIAVFDNGDV